MYVGLLKKIPLLTILNTKVPNPGPAPGAESASCGQVNRREGWVAFFLISEFVGRPSILIVYGSHYMDFGL